MTVTAAYVGRTLGTPGPVTLDVTPTAMEHREGGWESSDQASAVTVCVSRVGQTFRPVADTGKSSVNCDRGGTKLCPPHMPAGSRGPFLCSSACLIPPSQVPPRSRWCHSHPPTGMSRAGRGWTESRVSITAHLCPRVPARPRVQQPTQHGVTQHRVTVQLPLCGPWGRAGAWSAAETPHVVKRPSVPSPCPGFSSRFQKPDGL